MTFSSRSGSTSIVSFEVGEVLYAIDIHKVREIIKPLAVHRMPHSPDTVIGVADHRGDVVPIVDLRMRFGLAERPGASAGRWIIVRRGVRLVGFVVDRVVEVFDASTMEPREAPEIGHGNDIRGIVAAYAHRGRLVFVVDADKLASVALGVDPEVLRLAGPSEVNGNDRLRD